MSEAEPAVYFFDTSALVKRYHREKGTDVVDAAFDRADTRWISDLSVIEAYSAFARKVRTGEITEEDFAWPRAQWLLIFSVASYGWCHWMKMKRRRRSY